ncbi:hypothetical protein OIU79_019030 [Salix purpurea]|uniref:Uncharacterized protein n=1 Tax=Salix purpurea TaxID=77065 RepID=A0A9Q0SIN1_SALPP|nr:hypothetical protein OIU79_019030 [Salix purpurea]
MLKLEVAIPAPGMDFDFNEGSTFAILDYFDSLIDGNEDGAGIPFHWEERPGTPKSPRATTDTSTEDDFAFDFSAGSEKESLSADELFYGGKIRPLKLPPRLQLKTLAREQKMEEGGRGKEVQGLTSSSSRRASRSLSPFRVSECPWEQANQSAPNPKVAVPSNSSSSKSSSKKWRLRDLFLFRSASEGHARDKDHLRKYSGLFKKHEDGKDPSSRPTDSSGSVSSKRKGPVSAHELHYTVNKAVSDNLKKKTFLPYKRGIFGRLAFNPAAHGFGTLTR